MIIMRFTNNIQNVNTEKLVPETNTQASNH